DFMEEFLTNSEVGKKGVSELAYVHKKTKALGLKNAQFSFDVTLARGLNYYTGAIIEVTVENSGIGSICGGGRYDDLTGLFGLDVLSGVGISFGADRIYDVLETFQLFTKDLEDGLDFLFINFGEKEADFALPIIKELRSGGKIAEIYPEAKKLKKQFK